MSVKVQTSTVPLADKEVKHLISVSQQGDQMAREKLMRHNYRLVWSVVQRFLNRGHEAVHVNRLDLTQKEGVATYLKHFFEHVRDNQIVDPKISLQYVIGDHLKTLGLIWLLSLSVIGIPLALGIVFFKGMILGFNISLLFSQFSWAGLWFACTSIIPQNLIIIPVYILVSVSGVAFAVTLVKNRLIYHRGELYPRFLSFSFVVLGAVPILIISALFQSYISPYLMRGTLPFGS